MSHLFGWVPPRERTREMHEQDERIRSSLPSFSVPGYREEKGQWFLWEFSKRLNGGRHVRYVNQVTGSCFPADTPVQMADGTEKAIQDIRVGDEVISHTGQKRKVVRTFQRDYTGEMYTFHLKGHRFPFTVTADHDVMVVPCREGRNVRYAPGEPMKVKADEVSVGERMMLAFGLQGDEDVSFDLADFLADDGVVADEENPARVRMARHQKGRSAKVNRAVRLDERLAWLLGLYLAEGTAVRNTRKDTVSGFLLSLGSHEREMAARAADYINEIFGGEVAVKVGAPSRSKTTVLQVKVYSTVIGRFVHKLFPGNVWSKRLPAYIFRAKKSVRLAFLRGWMDGDGHMQSKANCPGRRGLSLRGVSASSELIRDMARLCLSCEMAPSALRRKRAAHQRVAAMDLYLSGRDALAVYPEREEALAEAGVSVWKKRTDKVEHGLVRKVERIDVERVVDLPVYCCEVEVDHTLVVNSTACGQCVGAGYANALRTLAYVEISQGQMEEWDESENWWVWVYGRGRMRGGLGGRGEGSFGSAQAEAAVKDGVFSRAEAARAGTNLQDFQRNENWLVLPKEIELEWSDGRAKESFAPLGAKHLVKTAARIRSSAEAKAALQNGYPITVASMFGTRTIRAQGSPQVQLAEWDDRWAHQMSCLGCWDHPTLGLIFYIMNQWGSNAHPAPLQGEPIGGFWVKASTFDVMLQSEGFAFSAFDGFPARKLTWFI